MEGWLRALAAMPEEAWTYLTVSDRTDRASEANLGRLDRPVAGEARVFGQDPADELVGWVRRTATGNAGGQHRTTFRVRAWTSKGIAPAGSMQFAAVDDRIADPDAVHQTPQEVIQAVTVEGIRPLADYYRELMRLVLDSSGDMLRVQKDMVLALADELKANRGHLARLFGETLSHKREIGENEALIEVARTESATRTAVIEKTGSILSEAVNAAVRGLTGAGPGPGVEPGGRLKPLLDSIQAQPALAAKLGDPKVAKALRNPEIAAMLAEMLETITEVNEESEGSPPSQVQAAADGNGATPPDPITPEPLNPEAP